MDAKLKENSGFQQIWMKQKKINRKKNQQALIILLQCSAFAKIKQILTNN